MYKRVSIFTFLILATLFGCASPHGIKVNHESQNLITPTISYTNIPVEKEAPIKTETPSSPPLFVPTLETVTPSPPTLTAQEAAGFQRDCYQMVSALPEDSAVRGKIILIGDSIYSPNGIAKFYVQLSAYDFQTHQNKTIPPNRSLSLAISPDGKYYAAMDASNGKIMVYLYDGTLINVISQGSTPWNIDQWLDNKHIVMVVDKPIEGTTYYHYPHDVVVINPFNNEQEQIGSDYPDIDNANARIGWEGNGTTKYDSSLTRVIYAGAIKIENSKEYKAGYILWDLINKKKLAEIATEDFGDTPKWSPDQSKIIVNSRPGDFYLVTRDGRVSKITNLNPEQLTSINSAHYSSHWYSWSPDGKRVALWLESSDVNGSVSASLALLTIDSGEIVDTCISAGVMEGGHLFGTDVPVWSPDGQYLAIKANRQENRDSDVLLVDFKNKQISKIDRNLSPVGWLYVGDSK